MKGGFPSRGAPHNCHEITGAAFEDINPIHILDKKQPTVGTKIAIIRGRALQRER